MSRDSCQLCRATSHPRQLPDQGKHRLTPSRPSPAPQIPIALWRTASAITPEAMLRHVRPVAGPTLFMHVGHKPIHQRCRDLSEPQRPKSRQHMRVQLP